MNETRNVAMKMQKKVLQIPFYKSFYESLDGKDIQRKSALRDLKIFKLLTQTVNEFIYTK